MSDPAPQDYYELLSVDRAASLDDIKRAYRKAAVQYHPDRNPDDPRAEEMFKRCTEAYAVLSDSEKRARYDRMGPNAFAANGGAPNFEQVDLGSVSEILEGLLGEMFRGVRGATKKAPRIGEDIRVDVSISFEQAALGAETTIEIDREVACTECAGTGAAAGSRVDNCTACAGSGEVRFQRGFFAAARACSACNGSGKKAQTACSRCEGHGTVPKKEAMVIRVPAGVEDGSVRTVRGAGKRGPGGPGDLHVHIKVEPHPIFTREGADIVCDVPVSFPQAVLGAQLDVPTLEGKVKMKLPPGTQSGKIFRLRGKGLPAFGGVGKGDQLVKIAVEVPEQITKKQRKLLEELALEFGAESHPQQASFVDKLRRLFDA